MRLEKLVYSEYLHGKQFPVGTIYECAKEPLHDFRRSMYVQYN